MITRGEGSSAPTGRARIRGSGASVQGAELTRPLEDASVGGEELVAFEGGGDDDAVGGVSVHSGQESCPSRYDTIYGNFNDAILDDVFSPRIRARCCPRLSLPFWARIPASQKEMAEIAALPSCSLTSISRRDRRPSLRSPVRSQMTTWVSRSIKRGPDHVPRGLRTTRPA